VGKRGCYSNVSDISLLVIIFFFTLEARVGKNPGFFKKTQPSGFFWVFLVFFGFFGFFWVFLGFFAQKRGFLGFFQFHEYL
jgi:hypothetical protein